MTRREDLFDKIEKARIEMNVLTMEELGGDNV